MAVHVPDTSLDTAIVELSQTLAGTVSEGLLSARIVLETEQAPLVPVMVTFWLAVGAVTFGGLKVTPAEGLVPVNEPAEAVHVTLILLETEAVVLSHTVAGTVKEGL